MLAFLAQSKKAPRSGWLILAFVLFWPAIVWEGALSGVVEDFVCPALARLWRGSV